MFKKVLSFTLGLSLLVSVSSAQYSDDRLEVRESQELSMHLIDALGILSTVGLNKETWPKYRGHLNRFQRSLENMESNKEDLVISMAILQVIESPYGDSLKSNKEIAKLFEKNVQAAIDRSNNVSLIKAVAVGAVVAGAFLAYEKYFGKGPRHDQHKVMAQLVAAGLAVTTVAGAFAYNVLNDEDNIDMELSLEADKILNMD